MAESIKFTDKYIDTTGVYDSTLNKTQQVINSKLVTVDTSSSSIGTPNPVNADTFGGYALSNFVRTSQLVNNFTTATAGLYALDAAAGKTLNDSITNTNESIRTNILRVKQQSIPISNISIAAHSKATVLNWGQVAATYLPGCTLVGAVYIWGSGGYTFAGNCQVNATDGTVFLEVYNPHTSSIVLASINLLLFYRQN